MYAHLEDYRVQRIVDETVGEIIDYGVKMVGAALEWPETMGENIRVGVIDTGIDLYHQDLRKNIKGYMNFTTDNKRDVTDENGHGTHVAGIVAAAKNNFGVIGVAPKADLYIAKVFGKDGTAQTENISKSVDFMLDSEVQIINMSFSTDGYDPEFEKQIQKAFDKGVVMVCAAGNDGMRPGDTIRYPARFDQTISVAAVDLDRQRAPFSSRGEAVDVAAVGTEILSCYPGNKFARLSGTSMAAPIISGAAAIMQAKAKTRLGRFLMPDEMKLVLSMYTEDLGQQGRDTYFGAGLFSFARLCNMKNNSVARAAGKIFA